MSAIADRFVEHRLADGGWNCLWVEGSRRSSSASTLNAVVGLLDHEIRTGGSPALRQARRLGEEYLLQRGLVRRLSTGQVHAPWATHLAYPYRWHCSVLRVLEWWDAGPIHREAAEETPTGRRGSRTLDEIGRRAPATFRAGAQDAHTAAVDLLANVGVWIILVVAVVGIARTMRRTRREPDAAARRDAARETRPRDAPDPEDTPGDASER